MLNKWAPAVAVAAMAAGAAVNVGGLVLLRRKELGNNCGFIADEIKGMKICMPTEVPKGTNWLVRWGTTTKLPAANDKANVINFASAIIETSDKGTFRAKAHKAGLTPKTWLTFDELAKDEEGAEAVIIRSRHHERSEGINLCKTPAQAEAAIKKITAKGDAYYISEYVKKDREFRVFVANGRAFMVFEKKPRNKADVSWGCVEEGALEYVNWSEWPLHVVENAIKAFNLSKLHFGAVDVIEKAGKAYFLEINTAPEVWPYYGQRFADVFKWMFKKGTGAKAREPIAIKNFKDWKNLIHPAITDKAIV